MAIVLEFINLLVRRSTIEEKYPGGWAGCLRDYQYEIGGRVWYDDHLFRDGAMNPLDMKMIVEEWERLGFTTQADVEGKTVWQDVCVMEERSLGPIPPCEWIEVDHRRGVAYLAGTEPGEAIGRGDNT